MSDNEAKTADWLNVYVTSVGTVDFDTLAKLAGTRKVKAVAMWCARNSILTFRDTKKRPCTTIDALNRALNRGSDIDNEPNYELPERQKPIKRRS